MPSAPGTLLKYCPDLYHYQRRQTRLCMVGDVGIGGDNPIRVQSMLTSDTRDAGACVKEALELAAAGCEIVRVTAQTRVIAENLEHIRDGLRAAGCNVPLVADIHFKPDAAMEAVKWVEKVRVNPGNYADKKKFAVKEYTDEQYAEEVAFMEAQFVPLVLECKRLGRAMRIGTNHGSLSDRIMNRHGDTPLGMVESALEFARIARSHDYHNFLFSMKASNPKVMIEAYRLLVAKLNEQSRAELAKVWEAGNDPAERDRVTNDEMDPLLGFPSSFVIRHSSLLWNYPIHLGVTEAGDGEDGRIKSAIGIGSLLADGIGDTIRVSLTEDAVHEIPVAQALVAQSGCGILPQSVLGASSPQHIRLTAESHEDGLRQNAAATSHVRTPDQARNLYQDSQHAGWNPNAETTKKRGTFLPHWTQPGGTYAVTFRLADSLPQSVLDDYKNRKASLEARIDQVLAGKGSSDAKAQIMPLREELAKLYFEIIEPALHQNLGACWLRRSEIAGLVCSALKHFDAQRYDLIAWCVMSNHVHVLFKPFAGHSLPDILHSWKAFTARKANKLINRTGEFWQREYYDHLIRDADDYIGQLRYILDNPIDARIEDHPWVGSHYGRTWHEASASREAKSSGCGILPQSVSAAFSREPDALGAESPRDGLRQNAAATEPAPAPPVSYDPFTYERRASEMMTVNGVKLGGHETVRVFTTRAKWDAVAHKLGKLGDFKPEIVIEDSGVIEIDPRDDAAISTINGSSSSKLVTVRDGLDLAPIHAFRLLAAKLDARHPILLKDTLSDCALSTEHFLNSLLTAATNIGSLLCDGIGDAVIVNGESAPGQSLRISYNILQAAGTRIFKTDYVACPSCGRTLFNLQSTTQKIRASTGHLKGVRIAVMGCIVNGPGEMADADFGYVGGAPGKINLYVGKTAVKFNIPEDEAVERLVDLIREHDKWVDAPAVVAAV